MQDLSVLYTAETPSWQNQDETEVALAVITAKLTHLLSTSERDLLEAGYLLIRAKQLVGHGKFVPWLKDNFQMSCKTANRFMSVSHFVDKHQLEEHLVKRLMKLDLKTLYELASKSTSQALQEQALYQLNKGPITYEWLRALKELDKQNQAPLPANPKNLSRMTKQLARFDSWITQYPPLLTESSTSLKPDIRHEIQLHTQSIKESIYKIEQILESCSLIQPN